MPATDADRRIGARVREARLAAGQTQRTVAAVAGFSAAQLQKYEKGDNRISASSLQIIGDFLGRPVASFFDARPEFHDGPDDTASEARDLICFRAILALVEARAAPSPPPRGAARADRGIALTEGAPSCPSSQPSAAADRLPPAFGDRA